MLVLVVGATSGTGRLLVDRLLASDHTVRGLARDPDKGAALTALGVEVVAGDLTGDGIDESVAGVDAVAFCAGSGGSTGKDQTLLVDLHGALRTVDAALAHGVRRYVMLSSMAADDPLRAGADAAIAPYLAAKHAADRVLAGTELDWTIVRPGGLTDDDPTGRVHTGQVRIPDDQRGARTIPRADVAAVLAGCLDEPATIGATFEVLSGEVEVATALGDLRPVGPNAPRG